MMPRTSSVPTTIAALAAPLIPSPPLPVRSSLSRHTPAPSQSDLPSSHAVLSAFGTRDSHRPVDGTQVLASRQSVAGSHTTPTHLRVLAQEPAPSQKLCVVSSPSSVQGVEVGFGDWMLHLPVVATQVLRSRQSVAGGQITPLHLKVPMHEPEPSHTSSSVVALPSSQGVPFEMGARTAHVPVVGVQVLVSRQSVAGGQLTPLHLGVPMQVPVPSH